MIKKIYFVERLAREYKQWRFERRKKQAISTAQQLANEQRMKFLVLNIGGKPVVTSMQRIRQLVKAKRIKYSPDYYRSRALYTAMPVKK